MARGKYTVNEVEERTKVPASTLRQWERRYGFPKPERSDAGYRLYSDADLNYIETMKRHIAQGVPASRAAELVKRATPFSSGSWSLAQMRRALVSALLDFNETRANEILSEAYALHTVEAIMLELIQGAITDIGQLWHEGKVKVTVEHFASSYLQGRLRALVNFSANPKQAPAVVVACAPSEQHELGPLIMAVLLCRAGYHVYYVGADTPLEDLAATARELEPVGMMISASTNSSMQHLMDQRSRLQGIDCLIAFGGAAFDERPELARTLGGTYLARSALDAIARFGELVQRRGAMRA